MAQVRRGSMLTLLALVLPMLAASSLAAAAPDNAAAANYAQQAETYGAGNQPLKAMQAIQQALRLQPQNPAYLHRQAKLAMWLGDLRLAAESYQTLIELNPRDTEALLAYSETEIYRGDYAHAEQLQQRYLEIAGNDFAYRKARSNLYARSGRPAAALQMLPPLLDSHPDDYELNLTHSLALNEHRERAAAYETLPVLERLGPERPETRGARLQVETPMRPLLGAGLGYYSDSDNIRMQDRHLFGAYSLTPALRFQADIFNRRLTAEGGSGLDPLSGSRAIQLDEYRLSGRYQFSPELAVRLGLGEADNGRGDDTATALLNVDFWPNDQLTAGYEFRKDVVDVSPRAVHIFIPRDNHRLRLGWRPDYRLAVDGELLYADYDDGNSLQQLTVSPRWATLRTEDHNLDLGFMAQWFSFDRDLNNGYYDPEQYLRLWGVAYYYRKLSDNDGVSVVLGLGPERDRDLDSGYEFGGNLRVEGIFGIYRDWQLRAYAATGGRFNDSGAGSAAGSIKPFRSYSFGLEFLYRF